ncbi:MAG: TlpA family protein disulfide reductase, partial [Actinomycetota bacterium]
FVFVFVGRPPLFFASPSSSPTARFTSSIVEDGGYLGVPLGLALLFAAWEGRRRRATLLVLAFVALAALLSLGPILHVFGEERGWLPGDLLARLPLFEHATPQRFTAYMAIGVSVVLAMWLASPGRRAVLRWAIVVVGAVALLPDLSSPPYRPELRVPRFVATGAWQRALEPDEVVYAVPAAHGEELVWQVESGQGFRLSQGYLGPIPRPYAGIPGSRGLALDHPSRRWPAPGDLARWFAYQGVRTILVDERAQPQFRVLLDVAMGWEAERVEDVFVYRPGPDAIRAGAAPQVAVDRFVVGEPAPDVTLAALDGGPVRLGDLRGRPVVLAFLASWCLDGCERQLEALRNLVAGVPGVDVVAAMVSDAPADARAFLAGSDVRFAAAGLDPDGIAYLGTGSAIVPTTVVIAADGTVLRVLVDPLTPDLFPRSVAAILAAEG